VRGAANPASPRGQTSRYGKQLGRQKRSASGACRSDCFRCHPTNARKASLRRPAQGAQRIRGRCCLASALTVTAIRRHPSSKSDGLGCPGRLGAVVRVVARCREGQGRRSPFPREADAAAWGSLGHAIPFRRQPRQRGVAGTLPR